MNEYLLYFVSEDKYTILVYENMKKRIEMNYKKIIEQEFLKMLMTYDGRNEAIRKRWGEGYNLPIILSNELCFVRVNTKTWVNIKKISYISKEGCVYIIGGMCITSNIKYRSLKQRLLKAQTILEQM